MDSTNNSNTSTLDFSGPNSYVKRQVWSYISTKYQNIDRVNQELIYNAVILEISDTNNYEELYVSLQIEDEEQRIAIINQFLSKLVPSIVERMAFKKNIAAKNSTVKQVRENLKTSNLRFSLGSVGGSFSTSNLPQPTGEASYSEAPSAYSQILQDKYKLELQKLGNPSATDLDFNVKTNRALEETINFQHSLSKDFQRAPKIFDPKTKQFQDFHTSLINQRISKLVATGVVQPHGDEERKGLIESILKGDMQFFEQFHISKPDIPPVGVIFPQLSVFVSDVKKTINGDVVITNDPLEEFDDYTSSLRGNSDARALEEQERNTLSSILNLDLTEKSLQIQSSKEVTVSEGVDAIETVIGFSEALAANKDKISRSDVSQRMKELGVPEEEFKLPVGYSESEAQTKELKPYRVSSDVVAEALTFAISQSKNSKKLSSEDIETLENVRSQVLGISGRMAMSFRTEEELERYVKSIRELNSAELYDFLKNYSKTDVTPELRKRLVFLQAKLSLEHSNAYQKQLDKKTRSEQKSLTDFVGFKILTASYSIYSKFSDVKENIEFLKILKRDGVIPALGFKKLDVLIMGTNALGLREVADLLEKYKKVKKFIIFTKKFQKIVKSVIFRNKSKINRAITLLSSKNIKKGKLSLTRKALSLSKSSVLSFSFLQNDALRIFRDFINDADASKFLSRSKKLSKQSLTYFKDLLGRIKANSPSFFSKSLSRLEVYASSKKLFSGAASLAVSFLKKINPFVKEAISKVSQKFSKLLSKINLSGLKPLLGKASGIAGKASKSALSKTAQVAAYQASKLLAHKAMIIGAKTAAKAAIGAATGGVGFVVLTAVEFVGFKRVVIIILSIILAIITVILLLMYIIFSTIAASFNSSSSDTSQEKNIGYTYGTVSGSDLSLSILGGSMDSSACKVTSPGEDWDNVNKKDFTNIEITTTNCRIVCNMARAIASAQKGSNRCVGNNVNCNPNYFNGITDKFGPSGVIAPPEGCGSFNYYACNYLTFSAMDTPGNVIDPDLRRNNTVLWSARKPYQYCVSKPFRHIDPEAWNGIDEDVLEANIRSQCAGQYVTTPADPLSKYIAVPLRTQKANSRPLCVPREYVTPGAILFWSYGDCSYTKSGGTLTHTGLVLGLFNIGGVQYLRTAETNSWRKSVSWRMDDCIAKKFDASGNSTDVSGVIFNDGGRGETSTRICRLYFWPEVDVNCPTGSGAFNCADILPGTPGFMRD